VLQVGRGGYSEVYRATLPTGQVVAAKVLIGASEETNKLLKREAYIMSLLKHPSVVPFYGAWP
jgi:serine/threonine protein kinase